MDLVSVYLEWSGGALSNGACASLALTIN